MNAAPQPEPGPSPAPILALEGLTRRFGGLTAVDRCSFTIGAGRITGMIGPNGAGKTTIFSMVAGALPPSAGRILFDGEDINYEGASGAIEFDENGDVAGIYSLNVVGDDGTWTPVM